MMFKTKLTIIKENRMAILPVVDMLFLLFIFFMLGSSTVFKRGLKVDLPVTIDEPKEVADKYVITLTRHQVRYFNDHKISRENWKEDLVEHLQEMDQDVDRMLRMKGMRKTRDTMPVIILKADKDVPYDDVVQVISVATPYASQVLFLTSEYN